MKLLVAPDSSLFKTPDGNYWCKTIYSYDFFERYLTVFDEIVVVSRVKEANYSEVKGYLKANGPKMTVVSLPDMHGMSDYIRQFPLLFRYAKAAAYEGDCAIFRLPSIPAAMTLFFYQKLGKKYFLEVVADPQDAYSESFAASVFFTYHLKRACLEADGVSYVTQKYLQEKYPSYIRKHGNDDIHYESFYSTIRLPEEYYSCPRQYTGKKSFRVIHTANNMNNKVKGHEVLLRAVHNVITEGYDISLTFVGDGTLRDYLEELSLKLGIANHVTFTGLLSGSDAVREELLKADLLVFPTKAEGLPRTIIEAMATGLPCISTPVAGIPELLEPEDMLPPDDYNAFAKRIIQMINHPDIMERKSQRNIDVARAYSERELSKRRDLFYASLRSLVDKR